MISHDLIVKDLLLLQLRHQTLDFLGYLEEAETLLLLISGFVISQVHKNGLVMMALILDLLMEGIYFLTHLG